MVSLLSRYLFFLTAELRWWSLGPGEDGEPTVKVLTWPCTEWSCYSLGLRAHGVPSVWDLFGLVQSFLCVCTCPKAHLETVSRCLLGLVQNRVVVL